MQKMNRQWLLQERPKPGPISNSSFSFKEFPLATLKDGEFLLRNRMISFDPTQRFWMERDTYIPAVPLGTVMQALCIAEVAESKNSQYKVGTRVSGLFGWQDYVISNGKSSFPLMTIPNAISDEAALSIFGMTGLTALFGMRDIGKPQAGQTVVVSGASGATGSIAAQIARILGAKVIGIAGGEQKCQWLLDKAGINAAIDYKKENVASRLQELAPKGIHVYFDNVGGKILDDVLKQLAMHARVVLCGAIATYNKEHDGAIRNYLNLVMTRSLMQGFLINDYASQFKEGIETLGEWLKAGLLCYEVDKQHGLENAPQTLQRLFEGKNLGKQVLVL